MPYKVKAGRSYYLSKNKILALLITPINELVLTPHIPSTEIVWTD